MAKRYGTYISTLSFLSLSPIADPSILISSSSFINGVVVVGVSLVWSYTQGVPRF